MNLGKKVATFGGAATAAAAVAGALPTDAWFYGLKTTATGAANAAALNTALATAKSVTVRPGTYDIAAEIIHPAGSTLLGQGNVVLRKSAQWIGSFARNSGKYTRVVDDGIRIENITYDCNNYDDTGYQEDFHNAELVFAWVSDLTLKNVRVINGAHNQTIQVVAASGVLIDSFDTAGGNGMLFCDARGITLRDIKGTPHDDFIEFHPTDWPLTTPTVGDCEDITIDGVEHRERAGSVGTTLHIMAGAWTDWASGNTYLYGDYCVDDGKIYQRLNTGSSVGTVAPSSVAATPGSNGTGVDGINWYCMRVGTFKTANVRNVSARNIISGTSFALFNLVSLFAEGWPRQWYPGTEGTSLIDNVIIDGATLRHSTGAQMIGQLASRIGSITLRNLRVLSGGLTQYGIVVYSLTGHIIDTMTLRDCIVTDWRATSGSVGRNAFISVGADSPGSIRKLILDGFNYTGALVAGEFGSYGPIIIDKNGGLSKLVVNNSAFAYATELIGETSDGHVNCEVFVSNTTFSHCKRVFALWDSTLSSLVARFSNCVWSDSEETRLISSDEAAVPVSVEFYGCATDVPPCAGWGTPTSVELPFSNLAAPDAKRVAGSLVRMSTGWQECDGATFRAIRNTA